VSEVEGGNIRIELLVSAATADRIWSLLAEDYFPHYAVAAWTVDVTVARQERYT
jgi:nitrogen regulatory protein P-II 2